MHLVTFGPRLKTNSYVSLILKPLHSHSGAFSGALPIAANACMTPSSNSYAKKPISGPGKIPQSCEIGILIHATELMNFENIILTEISQTLKDKYYMIPFMRNLG